MLLIVAYRANAKKKRKAAAKAYYTANPVAPRTVYRSKPDITKDTFSKYHATHRGVRLQYFPKVPLPHRKGEDD